MNSKNNLRFQQTEQVIRKVFIKLLGEKKELSKITITEICRLADINRTAFYLHHKDIYELLQCMETDMYQYFISLFTAPCGEYSLRERYLRFFTYLKEHQKFYRVYFNSQNHPQILDHTLFPELQKLAQGSDRISSVEYEYCQTFFITGLTAIIQKWLNNSCKESEEELLHILELQLSFNQKFLSLFLVNCAVLLIQSALAAGRPHPCNLPLVPAEHQLVKDPLFDLKRRALYTCLVICWKSG